MQDIRYLPEPRSLDRTGHRDETVPPTVSFGSFRITKSASQAYS